MQPVAPRFSSLVGTYCGSQRETLGQILDLCQVTSRETKVRFDLDFMSQPTQAQVEPLERESAEPMPERKPITITAVSRHSLQREQQAERKLMDRLAKVPGLQLDLVL